MDSGLTYTERYQAQGCSHGENTAERGGLPVPVVPEGTSEIVRKLTTRAIPGRRSAERSELEEGLSIALFKGLARQLGSMHMARGPGFISQG